MEITITFHMLKSIYRDGKRKVLINSCFPLSHHLTFFFFKFCIFTCLSSGKYFFQLKCFEKNPESNSMNWDFMLSSGCEFIKLEYQCPILIKRYMYSSRSLFLNCNWQYIILYLIDSLNDVTSLH